MSVIAFRGRDPESEARALLNCVLSNGDIIGIDDSGRTALLLVLDPWTLDRLLAFDADAVDLEDTDGPEPDQEIDGPAIVLDFAPKRLASRCVQTLALALLLVTGPLVDARADQAPMVMPLPMSAPIAQADPQCCRVCKKGVACGDGCISSAKQCRRPAGCACSAPSSGS